MSIEPASLTASAVALLIPYLTTLGTEAAKAGGEAVVAGGRRLLGWLKERLTGKARDALAELEKAPADEAERGVFEARLKQALATDPALLEGLRALLAELPKAATAQTMTFTGDANKGAQTAGDDNEVNIGWRAVAGPVLRAPRQRPRQRLAKPDRRARPRGLQAAGSRLRPAQAHEGFGQRDTGGDAFDQRDRDLRLEELGQAGHDGTHQDDGLGTILLGQQSGGVDDRGVERLRVLEQVLRGRVQRPQAGEAGGEAVALDDLAVGG